MQALPAAHCRGEGLLRFPIGPIGPIGPISPISLISPICPIPPSSFPNFYFV